MVRHIKSRRRHASHKKRFSRHRRQHGGGSCAAMPQTNQAFAQRGGMAPIAQGDSYLLDAATRVQAEVGPLDKSFGELPSVIPKQMGGRRKANRKSRKVGSKGRKSRKAGRKSRKAGRKSRKAGRKSRHAYRHQHGGMMDFDSAYRYQPQGGYAGENNQIHTEQTVNPMFKIAGAQA